MSPVSSCPALICFRSVARIAPSLMGTSYCLPVRLSVMVSVSAITKGAFSSRIVVGAVTGFVGVFIRRGRQRLRRHAIVAVYPLRQILQLAALAAERLPCRLHRVA